MGMIQHTAVLATCGLDNYMLTLMKWVKNLTDQEKKLFHFSQSWANGYETIILSPDGSKEGWAESDKGDALRARFIHEIERLNTLDEMKTWEYIEVGYGEFGPQILRTNSEDMMNDDPRRFVFIGDGRIQEWSTSEIEPLIAREKILRASIGDEIVISENIVCYVLRRK